MYRSKPQLVIKHVLPAAFALVNEPKGELRSANEQLLVCLTQLLGTALLDHIGNLNAVAQQKVKDLVLSSLGGGYR